MMRDGKLLGLKNSIDIYRLRLKMLKKSSVLTIPTVATLIFVGVMYSIKPYDVCSSFLLSAVFLYFICLFLSMSLNGRENDVYEETISLHSVTPHSYYCSRELLLITLGICYALVLTLVPAILFFMDNTSFVRHMGFEDIACGGLHIFMCGLGGITIGDFFHPRIFRKRRDAIIGALAISLLAVSKEGLINLSAAFSILNLVLPPITDGFKSVGNSDFFNPVNMMIICIHFVIYYLVILMLKIQVLEKKKSIAHLGENKPYLAKCATCKWRTLCVAGCLHSRLFGWFEEECITNRIIWNHLEKRLTPLGLSRGILSNLSKEDASELLNRFDFDDKTTPSAGNAALFR